MAIYYVDPFKNTDGTGTFADPRGMWFNPAFTLAAGDELRIIGRTLASMLTATEYTVTIRDSAVASDGGALSALSGGADGDFLRYDIVYFPDYDVFMRLSAGTFSGGNYLSGTYNAIPIPVAGKLTGVRMRLVNRAILPTFTTNASYLYTTSALANGGFTITDNWTADGVRTTDGTAKTLVTTASTIAINNYFSGSVIISESLKSTPTISADLSNSYFISGKSTSTALNIRVVDLYNTTATIAQVYSNGTGNSTLPGISGVTQYGYGNNITIKNINFYTTLIFALATNSTYKFENVVSYNNWQNSDTYSKYCNNTVIEVDKIHCYNTSDGFLFHANGAQGLTVKFNQYVKFYDIPVQTTIFKGTGNVDVQFGAGFSATKQNNSATAVAVTATNYALYDNTAFAQQNETYYRKPNLPAGFTVTNEFGLAIPAGNTVYPLGNGKRVATRKMVLEGFSSISRSLITNSGMYSNTVFVSADGGFTPIEQLCVTNAAANSTGINPSFTFFAEQDATIFKTISPSLKFSLISFNSSIWVGNATGKKARAYKNTAIPCVAGTPLTVSGWVRTSDTSYVSGDFSVSLVDANGDDVATEFNPTAAFINDWEQFSFTVTPTYTGELFLAFGMTGYRGGQTYWVSDLGVS